MPGFCLPKEGTTTTDVALQIPCQMASIPSVHCTPSIVSIDLERYQRLVNLRNAIMEHDQHRAAERGRRVVQRQQSRATQSLPSLQAYLSQDPKQEEVVVSRVSAMIWLIAS
jgi:hypothetical protein